MDGTELKHSPDSEYAYPMTMDTLRLVLRVRRGRKYKEIGVLWNNKYEFTAQRKYTRMRYQCRDKENDYYICELRSADVRYAYIFLLTLKDGREYYYSEEGLTEEYDFKHGYYTFFQYPYINGTDVLAPVRWAEGAVVYEIFVDRYRCGDGEKDVSYITQSWEAIPGAKDYAGGDLKGITEKLGEIAEMGFNTLYLTPVFKSPSNHKYNVTDYERVDSMFGGNAALSELITTAHARGMKLILDTVFNHCDESNAFFSDVKEKGRKSEYYDWFIIHGDRPEKYDAKTCNYEIFADCTYMPKWNTSNPKVREYLIGLAEKYLRWGIDGLRLDVADEVSHTFWRELRRAVKAKYPEALLIGEVWHESGMYLRGDEFDGAMNYKLQKILADYFGRETLTASEAAEKLNGEWMRHRRQTQEMMLNFLDDHDTPRFLRVCGESEENLRAALVALYFWPGLPCVMYGTEQPLTGDSDPDCRRTYDWTRERRHGEFLRELSRMRQALPKGECYATTERGVLTLVRETAEERAAAYFGKTETRGEVIFEYEDVKVVKERKWSEKDC